MMVFSQLVQFQGDHSAAEYLTISPPMWTPFAELWAAYLTALDPVRRTHTRVCH